VKSAFAAPAEGDEQWLIKFDGVSEATGGPVAREDVRPGPWGRIEYAYSRMARAAGIEMAETHLLCERSFAHFMTRRFDRVGDQRLHLHTLGGLQHVDYNDRGAFSYEEWFRTIRFLGMDQRAIEQAFRRTVFNLATVNQDDHVKNFAFLMTPDARWTLAPAYDVTYAAGNNWTRTHQMTLAGKDGEFTRADLLEAGATVDLPKGGAGILDEVEAAIATWEREAHAVETPPAYITRLAAQFRHFGK
jgi:serine/threonine-protein kinase HipA